MTTSRRHLTHALMIAGLAVGAWTAGEATHQDAAHADKPPAAEQPGGLLGGAVHLPAQAADTARDAVAKVAPGPAKPADKPEPKPKPTKAPKPTKPPADEPTHAPKPPAEDKPADDPPPATGDRPADPPVHVPPVEVPPVVVDPPPVVVNPPPVVETPPVVIEPTPIPTVPAPIPTPTLPVELPATPTAPATEPTLPVVQPAALPTAALPALVAPLPGLPILIGPTATPAAPIDPARAHDEPIVAALTAEALCTDDLNAAHIDLRRIRIPLNLKHHTDKAATTTAASGQPCPGHPGSPDGPAITALAVKPPPPTGEQLVADNVAGAYSPALQRLHQLRGRGDLPAGRTQHPEPGPA